MKGNVIDLAVGVVIGAAFGKIVTSLVNDVVMPVLGILTGSVDFSRLEWVLKPATETNPAVTIGYGLFINTVIQFLIIAFAIFIVIKQVNRLTAEEEKKEEEEAVVNPPEPSEEVKLLTEIRDAMRAR